MLAAVSGVLKSFTAIIDVEKDCKIQDVRISRWKRKKKRWKIFTVPLHARASAARHNSNNSIRLYSIYYYVFKVAMNIYLRFGFKCPKTDFAIEMGRRTYHIIL